MFNRSYIKIHWKAPLCFPVIPGTCQSRPIQYKPAGSVWFYHGRKICIFSSVKDKVVPARWHLLVTVCLLKQNGHYFHLLDSQLLSVLVSFYGNKKQLGNRRLNSNRNIQLILIFHPTNMRWTSNGDIWLRESKTRVVKLDNTGLQNVVHFVSRLWDGLGWPVRLSEPHVRLHQLMLTSRCIFLFFKTHNSFQCCWSRLSKTSLSHILNVIQSKFAKSMQQDIYIYIHGKTI